MQSVRARQTISHGVGTRPVWIYRDVDVMIAGMGHHGRTEIRPGERDRRIGGVGSGGNSGSRTEDRTPAGRR